MQCPAQRNFIIQYELNNMNLIGLFIVSRMRDIVIGNHALQRSPHGIVDGVDVARQGWPAAVRFTNCNATPGAGLPAPLLHRLVLVVVLSICSTATQPATVSMLHGLAACPASKHSRSPLPNLTIAPAILPSR